MGVEHLSVFNYSKIKIEVRPEFLLHIVEHRAPESLARLTFHSRAATCSISTD